MTDSNKVKATHVSYAANKHGYTVRVLSHNETIDEYNAGNNPVESASWIEPGPESVDTETLLRYARSTAKELAESHGLDESVIQENRDLLEAEE